MKVNLAQAGDDIKVNDDYKIFFAPGDYVILRFKATDGHRSCNFGHPNLALKTKTTHEFRSANKRWSKKSGCNLFFLINKKDINIYLEKGYSFIHAEVNGVDLTFSVCGADIDGWKDVAGRQIETNLNPKISDLKKISEVAFRDADKESKIAFK